MATKKSAAAKAISQIKKISFLIGTWHTSGEILTGNSEPGKIRGMDTYELVSGGCFILHRVDVMMVDKRMEAIELIGYDESRKSYFMRSFDNGGNIVTMFARLQKPGVLAFGNGKMRSTLKVHKRGNSMSARWELAENGKWDHWMNIQLDK